MLPATAAGQPFSVDTALQASRGNQTGIALQLFFAAMTGAAILFAVVLGKDWPGDLGAAPPFHSTVDILLTAFGWASQIPTVVILTRAYRQGAQMIDNA